ncbi:MAG: aminotransferase class I/II-fold pyridoxal phosphate-dependent enzyme [Salinivirgaceae bacterium]|nr:aminotransferase class I/II-fold pyridoxal phosphate-dependent enzyme [Salinivirgaceae bacterium]
MATNGKNTGNKHVSLNLNIRGISQSPTLAINELSKKLAAKGTTIYPMGLGQSPFPVPSSVVEELKAHAHEKDYLNVKGLEALRQAVAYFHKQKNKVDIKANHVLIGPGSKELMFILQMVYYGELILPTPCWVSYVPQAKIIGRNIKLIHTSQENKWRITHKQLSDFLLKENDTYKPRLLILNYPSNPDGGTYSGNELKKIAQVARKHELIILSDEIYSELHYKGEHVSIAEFYPEGTIISSGLSKWCGAGGWRLGTFAFPPNFEWLLNAMAAVASETYTSVCAPIQYAAIKAFKGGVVIERYLRHVRRILAHLSQQCATILKESGISVNSPDGAFYFFIDFTACSSRLNAKGIYDSHTLCEQLLKETGVAILPGEAFMRSAEELTARLAFVNFDGTQAIAKSETFPLSQNLPDNFAELYCPDTINGMKKIAAWVQEKSIDEVQQKQSLQYLKDEIPLLH